MAPDRCSTAGAAPSSKSCATPRTGKLGHQAAAAPSPKSCPTPRTGKLGPPVTLHVYDVSGDSMVQQVNDVFRPLSTGMFHAGVEILGEEWSFGWTESGSGLVCCRPRGNPQHKYRESVLKGCSPLTESQISALLARLHKEWIGTTYDLLARNCCHFADAFCRELGVGGVPEWVKNMAGAGAKLRSGVQEAVSKAHVAAEQFSDRVDAFTTSEVHVDEEYLGSKANELWAKATDQLGYVGSWAEKMINDAQKPIAVDVEKVETAALNFWSWATGQRPSQTVQTSPPAVEDAAAALCSRASREAPNFRGPAASARPKVVTMPVQQLEVAPSPRQCPSMSPDTALSPEPIALVEVEDVEPSAPPEASRNEQAAATAEQTRSQKAQRHTEFMISALDFGDLDTARSCGREALQWLEEPEMGRTRSSGEGEGSVASKAQGTEDSLPYSTKARAQRLAQAAATRLELDDTSAAAKSLREALQLLGGS